MEKIYKIEVDCANCASLMEAETKKIKGVAGAMISFVTQRMAIEFEDGVDEKSVMKDVLKRCRRIEPDCEIEF